MKTETLKNGLTVKQTLIGLVVIALLAFLAYVWASQPKVEAKNNYRSLTPAIQTQLEQFEKKVETDRCQLIKKLASAKLTDDMNGVKFENIDRNDLAAKRDVTCSF